MKVHYCQDQQLTFALIVLVHDTVGKAANETTANTFIDYWPHYRICSGTPYRGIDFNCKLVPKCLFSLLVVIDCKTELRLGLWMKVTLHQEKRFQTSSKTSSPGTPSTAPD